MELSKLVKIRKESFDNALPPKSPSGGPEMKVKPEPVDLAAYPWDQCIIDQTERYGDEETAKKVCGAIKAMYGRKEEPNA